MALEMKSVRPERYVNKTVSEYQQANRSPIDGYENEEVMPLENAIEKLIPLIDDIQIYVLDAKQKCNRNFNLLTWDESATIYLYTMPTNFFGRLNETLRAENRQALKPWFPFLKLFMAALRKLPSSNTTVWRAVAGNTNLFSLEDDVQTW